MSEKPGGLCIETVAKIRRRRLVEGETISGIARELRLSRNTVKKYLQQSEPPTYRHRKQRSSPCKHCTLIPAQFSTLIDIRGLLVEAAAHELTVARRMRVGEVLSRDPLARGAVGVAAPLRGKDSNPIWQGVSVAESPLSTTSCR